MRARNRCAHRPGFINIAGASPAGPAQSPQRLAPPVAARIDRGENVQAPGLPAHYPDPQSLVTDDCIQP